MEDAEQRATELCQLIVDLLESQPDVEINGFAAIIALSVVIASQIAALPRELRADGLETAVNKIREIVDEFDETVSSDDDSTLLH